MLEQLDRRRTAGPARSRRVGRASASHTPSSDLLHQQHLAARLLDRDPRRQDARVVDDDERVAGLLDEIAEQPVPDGAARPVVDQQPRLVAPLEGCWAINSGGRS